MFVNSELSGRVLLNEYYCLWSFNIPLLDTNPIIIKPHTLVPLGGGSYMKETGMFTEKLP